MLTALERLGREVRSNGDHPELSPERELELIREVQEEGSNEAFEELVRGYARGLSGCLRDFRSDGDMDVDEALSEVLIGFYENVLNYDLDGDHTIRLAYTVKSLRYRISAARDEQTLTAQIAPRTLRRYRALHKRYNGNLLEMFKHAPEEGLAQDHLMDIHAVLNSEDLAAVIESGEEPTYEEQEHYGPGDQDADLVAIAFASIADDQSATDVVWHSYNFDMPDLKRRRTDGDVAELLGSSRSVVQRTRAAALKSMRAVLMGGAFTEQEEGVAA